MLKLGEHRFVIALTAKVDQRSGALQFIVDVNQAFTLIDPPRPRTGGLDVMGISRQLSAPSGVPLGS